MEPGIFSQLKRYFQAGGNPLQVIEELSHNYTAVAQMANLIAEWLIIGGNAPSVLTLSELLLICVFGLKGVKVQDVQAMVENHLKEMILKSFDPKKADTIFTEEGETPAWLTQLIEHPTWRSLIYRLAEEYPDCLMLNFTIKVCFFLQIYDCIVCFIRIFFTFFNFYFRLVIIYFLVFDALLFRFKTCALFF